VVEPGGQQSVRHLVQLFIRHGADPGV
jgi:hypothetical protein